MIILIAISTPSNDYDTVDAPLIDVCMCGTILLDVTNTSRIIIPYALTYVTMYVNVHKKLIFLVLSRLSFTHDKYYKLQDTRLFLTKFYFYLLYLLHLLVFRLITVFSFHKCRSSSHKYPEKSFLSSVSYELNKSRMDAEQTLYAFALSFTVRKQSRFSRFVSPPGE